MSASTSSFPRGVALLAALVTGLSGDACGGGGGAAADAADAADGSTGEDPGLDGAADARADLAADSPTDAAEQRSDEDASVPDFTEEDRSPDAPDPFDPDAGVEPSCAPGDCPIVGETTQVVPSEFLPPEYFPQDANNNLDAARHDGRVWLAFRTAPFHFASPDATLYVVSSDDEVHWRFEWSFNLERDLREPRLLAWNDRLFLYFAYLGVDSSDFEPGGMMLTEYLGDGQWSEPEEFYGQGFIPWRARVIGGVPYLIAYDGGENIYDANAEPLHVHWLTTEDGRNWVPVIEDQPIVSIGGGSETDFAFAPDGALIAVERNEAGDETGWGSKVCRAEPGDLGNWQCIHDSRKFDSPIVFRHRDEIYLIARRNLNGSGIYDLGRRDLTHQQQVLQYEWDYWHHPKRCSVWRVDAESLAVEFLVDLPSRGDTCFPGVISIDEDSYAVYNYSNSPDGPDYDWIEGQQGRTQIYRTVLTFPRP